MDTNTILFFEQQPEALVLYEVFEKAVINRYPDIKIKVQKTQISFSNKHIFACASFLRVKKKKELPDPYLVITLGMPYPLDSAVSVGFGPCGRQNGALSGAVDSAYRYWKERRCRCRTAGMACGGI